MNNITRVKVKANTDKNYNIIKNAFIILVNKIFDLKLDDSTDIFNDANINAKLIKPLFP